MTLRVRTPVIIERSIGLSVVCLQRRGLDLALLPLYPLLAGGNRWILKRYLEKDALAFLLALLCVDSHVKFGYIVVGYSDLFVKPM